MNKEELVKYAEKFAIEDGKLNKDFHWVLVSHLEYMNYSFDKITEPEIINQDGIDFYEVGKNASHYFYIGKRGENYYYGTQFYDNDWIEYNISELKDMTYLGHF